MTESPYTCVSTPPNGRQLVARRAGRSVVRNDADTLGAHEYIVHNGDFHRREYRVVPYFAAATVADGGVRASRTQIGPPEEDLAVESFPAVVKSSSQWFL